MMKRMTGGLVVATGAVLLGIGGFVVATHTSLFAAGGVAGCGPVTVAEMNWPSARLMAHVDGFILEHGYGCDVQLVPGDTMPTGTSMIGKGEPDIAPELWMNSFPTAIGVAVREGRLKIAGKSLANGGEEGFWVPKYLVEQDPALATIEGVRASAALFEHPEDPDKAAFFTCPVGWNCHVSAANLFRALGLAEAGFSIVDPGSGAALAASIARAYELGAPWFGYYWAPTAILGKYEMVKVDFGVGTDHEHYTSCISKEDCADPRPTRYPPAPVETVTTASFANRAPAAFAYLENRSFSNADMNVLLAWMEDNHADGTTAAAHFLATGARLWTGWVPEEVAARVRAAMVKS